MTVLYSDINTGYTKNSQPVIITDLKDISESLRRLFHTIPGSNPFNREYGSSLYYLLFESSSSMNLTDIKVLLSRDIENWEPRVQLNPLDINISKIDEHTYQISCNFIVPSLNDTSSSVTTLLSDK